MRCFCGFDDIKYARIKQGKLTCPYCSGEIVCEPVPTSLCSPAQVFAAVALSMRRRKQESFWVFLLDVRNHLIGKYEVCKGSLASCMVHPREVFAGAVNRHAAAVILMHNHPSGDPNPSEEDMRLTERLAAAGQILGVPVMDHLIVTGTTYFSFREAGLKIQPDETK